MRVHLDTSILIYLVEDVAPFFAIAHARLAPEEIEKVTSELGRMEALVIPLRKGNGTLVEAFNRYIDTACMEVLELSRAMMKTAAALRAQRFSSDAGCDPSRCSHPRKVRCFSDERSPARSVFRDRR